MSQEALYQQVINDSRNAFNSGKTRPLAFRLAQLKKFIQMVDECRDELVAAVYRDLRKHKLEVNLYEIEGLIADSKHLMESLKSLAAPDKLPFNLLAAMDTGVIEKVPYGVVLVLGAWNYPVLLALQPFVGAIAAGNCVIMKPSEVSHHTASVLAKIFPKYLDTECYNVLQGNPQETQQLLTNKFDYIFFTGSSAIGKQVMMAAANNLTPVTLELGGKSPCYIDESSNYEIAAKRIMWGKYTNMGQTCIAPDYVICSKKVEAEFLKVASGIIEEWYGKDPQTEPSLGRIINERHCLRLKQLLESTHGNIAMGGKIDLEDNYIQPTIVVDVKGDDPLMQDEIFGPILPMITANSPEEAIAFINSKPRPLALYTFSNNSSVNKLIVEKTISGGVCINDTMWHGVWNGLPFGGVGDSGMGKYHGKFSFDTFSHHRAILSRSFSAFSEKLGEARYPPYTTQKIGLFTFIVRYFRSFNIQGSSVFTHLLALLVGVGIVLVYFLAIK